MGAVLSEEAVALTAEEEAEVISQKLAGGGTIGNALSKAQDSAFVGGAVCRPESDAATQAPRAPFEAGSPRSRKTGFYSQGRGGQSGGVAEAAPLEEEARAEAGGGAKGHDEVATCQAATAALGHKVIDATKAAATAAGSQVAACPAAFAAVGTGVAEAVKASATAAGGVCSEVCSPSGPVASAGTTVAEACSSAAVKTKGAAAKAAQGVGGAAAAGGAGAAAAMARAPSFAEVSKNVRGTSSSVGAAVSENMKGAAENLRRSSSALGVSVSENMKGAAETAAAVGATVSENVKVAAVTVGSTVSEKTRGAAQNVKGAAEVVGAAVSENMKAVKVPQVSVQSRCGGAYGGGISCEAQFKIAGPDAERGLREPLLCTEDPPPRDLGVRKAFKVAVAGLVLLALFWFAMVMFQHRAAAAFAAEQAAEVEAEREAQRKFVAAKAAAKEEAVALKVSNDVAWVLGGAGVLLISLARFWRSPMALVVAMMIVGSVFVLL